MAARTGEPTGAGDTVGCELQRDSSVAGGGTCLGGCRSDHRSAAAPPRFHTRHHPQTGCGLPDWHGLPRPEQSLNADFRRKDDPRMNSLQKARPTATSLKHEGRRRAALILFAGLALAAVAGCGGVKASAPPAKPPEVEVIAVAEKNVPITSKWTTTLDGYVNAQIQPRVSGYLIRQNYKEGTRVRQGEVLFEIDARPFVAALNGAKGQLAQAEAQLGKAEQDVKRDTPLAEAKAIAQSQLDNDIQAQLAAKAAAQCAKAAVERGIFKPGRGQGRALGGGRPVLRPNQSGELGRPTTGRPP